MHRDVIYVGDLTLVGKEVAEPLLFDERNELLKIVPEPRPKTWQRRIAGITVIIVWIWINRFLPIAHEAVCLHLSKLRALFVKKNARLSGGKGPTSNRMLTDGWPGTPKLVHGLERRLLFPSWKLIAPTVGQHRKG
ncbi:MAG: hypothetical protein ABIQ16_11320 [Polyangiaceae bacterium]